jgi:hypothetical protein
MLGPPGGPIMLGPPGRPIMPGGTIIPGMPIIPIIMPASCARRMFNSGHVSLRLPNQRISKCSRPRQAETRTLVSGVAGQEKHGGESEAHRWHAAHLEAAARGSAQLLRPMREGALVAARTLARVHEALAQLCFVHWQVCAWSTLQVRSQ